MGSVSDRDQCVRLQDGETVELRLDLVAVGRLAAGSSGQTWWQTCRGSVRAKRCNRSNWLGNTSNGRVLVASLPYFFYAQ